MKQALSHWKEISKRLDGKDIVLFCDFDGTLTPIRPRPGLAVLGSRRLAFLECLTRLPGLQLAFVSGRGLADLKEKVPVPGAMFAGNHGLEASGPGFKFLAPLPQGWRKILASVKRSLLPLGKGFPGILIEDKGLTLSVHYRKVAARKQTPCHQEVMALLETWRTGRRVTVHAGKKVVEIRPPIVWHKGAIVRWLWKHKASKAVAVFIGDDVTDEDAFRVIGSRGVTVHVGTNVKTAAQYHLANVGDVYGFLKHIRDLKS